MMIFKVSLALLAGGFAVLPVSSNGPPSSPSRGGPGNHPAHGLSKAPGKDPAKPNFVYILVDDQDAFSSNPDYMPLMSKYIAQAGANYTNFYAPTSLCCPSRTSFLRSQFAHNHNTTHVAPPFGGWEKFNQMGYNGHWFPSYMQEAGYQTYYSGKLMNGINVNNWDKLPAKGLNGSNLLLQPWTYAYCNASFSIDGGPPTRYNGQYSTDVIRDMGIAHIEKAVKSDQPFFVAIAPVAPHTQLTPLGNGQNLKGPPVPANRHLGRFKGHKVPRSLNFNPDVPSGASWVRAQPQRNSTQVDYIDSYFEARTEAVLAIDDLVEAVVKKLEGLGALDNTYVVYASDNGFSLGQHRRYPGKSLGYEEDIRVPFYIRGPGIEKGSSNQSPFNVADLSTTMLHVAGAESEIDVDGRIMTWGLQGASKKQIGTKSHHVSEYWELGNTIPGPFGKGETREENTLYRTIRVIEDDQDWAYLVWCTGERELYNMTSDHNQMNNLVLELNDQEKFAPITAQTSMGQRLASRLDGLLLWLKTCKGSQCRRSWPHLFPEGEVNSLIEALDVQWDGYFDSLPKVQYNNCDIGYHYENEFPYWTTDLTYSSYIIPAKAGDGGGGDRKRALLDGLSEDWEHDIVWNGVEDWMNGWLDL